MVPEVTPEWMELEREVWSKSGTRLPQVEAKVARIIQKDRASAFGHYLMALLRLRAFLQETEDLYALRQASDLAIQAIELEPKNPVGYVALANILDQMGAGERALKLLDEARRSGVASNWRFYFVKSRLKAGASSADEPQALLKKALREPQADFEILVPYAIALLQAELTGDRLLEALDSWGRDFPSRLFDLAIGVALAEAGRKTEAHRKYQEILKRYPDSREALVNDGVLLYHDLGREREGASRLARALSLDSEPLDPIVQAVVMAHLGAAQLKLGRFEEAEAQFLQAMGMEGGGQVGLLGFIKSAYEDRKKPELLVKLLNTANLKWPADSDRYASLGEILSERLHRHDEAVEAYGDAILLSPERSELHTGLGLAYYRGKNFGNALKSFSAAMKADPGDAVARYNKACVLSLMGRRDEALESLADALSLDPRLVETARKDLDFVNIKALRRFNDLVEAHAGDREIFPLSH
jgi:tetratricopeptide (TPR) repeat protein